MQRCGRIDRKSPARRARVGPSAICACAIFSTMVCPISHHAYVGTAALGCVCELSSPCLHLHLKSRASPGRTAEGGCPHAASLNLPASSRIPNTSSARCGEANESRTAARRRSVRARPDPPPCIPLTSPRLTGSESSAKPSAQRDQTFPYLFFFTVCVSP